MCLAIALAAFPLLAAADSGDSFAEVLHRVIRASRENFRPIEGARIEMHPGNISYFQAKVDLPGTKACRIDEHPVPAYSCQWTTPDCEKLPAKVAVALGEEWSRANSAQSRKTVFRHSGRLRLTEVSITAPTARAKACTITVSLVSPR